MFWSKKKKTKNAPPESSEKALEPAVSEIEPAPASEVEKDLTEQKQGWLSKLTGGLSKSTNKLTQGLSDFVTKRKLDDEALEELEDWLLQADLGPLTAAKIIEDFAKTRFGKEVDDQEIRSALAQQIEDILIPVQAGLDIAPREDGPYVLLMCGVNGAGKTTTIGKISRQLTSDGQSVMIAAGDTFRAAAVEQLQTWAERSGASFFAKGTGADAAALAYEAYAQAKEQGVDILMIDTAGRLQNKTNLMQELGKINRVLQKHDEHLPHKTILVLDSTTGQNAFSQVEIFDDIMNIDGLIVTKLDGSAKGGVLIGLADKFNKPVYAIGVGEDVSDLQPFIAKNYAQALMGVRT